MCGEKKTEKCYSGGKALSSILISKMENQHLFTKLNNSVKKFTRKGENKSYYAIL